MKYKERVLILSSLGTKVGVNLVKSFLVGRFKTLLPFLPGVPQLRTASRTLSLSLSIIFFLATTMAECRLAKTGKLTNALNVLAH